MTRLRRRVRIIEMVHVPAARLLPGEDDPVAPALTERVSIAARVAPTGFVPSIQMPELDTEDGGLQLVETAVGPEHRVAVPLAAAVVPEQPDPLGHQWAARHYHA